MNGVDNSTNFNTCTDSYYYYHNQNTEHFYHPGLSKFFVLSMYSHTFPQYLAPSNHWFVFYQYRLAFSSIVY